MPRLAIGVRRDYQHRVFVRLLGCPCVDHAPRPANHAGFVLDGGALDSLGRLFYRRSYGKAGTHLAGRGLSGHKPSGSKPNNWLLIPAAITGLVVVYYAAPFALAIASLGEMCPYSPAGTRFCAGHVSSAEYEDSISAKPGTPLPPDLNKDTRLCKKRGVRYKGETAEGAKVCFTLTVDRASWLEIGFTFTRASNCPGHVTGRKQIEGPTPLGILVC